MAVESLDSAGPPPERSWGSSNPAFRRPRGRTAPTDGITCGTGNDHRSTSDRSSRKDSERHLMAHQPRCPATQSEAAREVLFIKSLPHGRPHYMRGGRTKTTGFQNAQNFSTRAQQATPRCQGQPKRKNQAGRKGDLQKSPGSLQKRNFQK